MSFKPLYMINAKSATEVDILIYGVIGDSWYSDGNPGKRFVQDFKDLEKKYDRINVRVNSPGGSVHDGLPMFNAIKSSKKDVHTYNDGIAYSMGAMIMLAGKTVHSAQGSLWMLHNVSGGAMGNAKDMRKAADDMDIYDEVLGLLIASKTGKTEAQVKKDWMNYEDNFMSAKSAFEAKIVDVLESYDAADVPDNINDMSHDDIMAYYRPAQADTDISIQDIATQTREILNQNQSIENMGLFGSDFPVLNGIAARAAGVAITAEDIKAINAELKTKGIANVVIIGINDLTEANNNADALTTGLTAVNAALGEGKGKENLAEGITALVALNASNIVALGTANAALATSKTALDAANVLVAKYGAQPGALGTVPAVVPPAEGEAQAEGGKALDKTVVENKFKTSYDLELEERNNKSKKS